MKILITGGAGYIGSHIALDLIEKGNDVVIVDNLSSSKDLIVNNLKKITTKEFTFYAYNCVTEHLLDKVFSEHEFELVIHNAIDDSNTNPIETYDNNINSLLTITKLMMKYEVKNMVLSSTALVYGEHKQEYITEGITKKMAGTPYGVSMQICEKIIFSLEDKIKTAILRHYTPIGCHESGLLGSFNDSILSTLHKAYKSRTQFIIFGDNYISSDGTCIRDYIHINDLVVLYSKAIHWLMDSDKTDHFDLCTGVGYSVKQIIQSFENVYDYKFAIQSGNRRKGDLDRLVGNTDKMKNVFGFVPKIDINKAILDSGKWYEYLTNEVSDDSTRKNK